MKYLYPILLSTILMLASFELLNVNQKEQSTYHFSYGYRYFEDCETVDFSLVSYDVIYYKTIDDIDEYQIVLSQERRVFQIPENNKYIFYVYLENGMCLPVTRFLGVSREIPMENEEKGIIQI